MDASSARSFQIFAIILTFLTLRALLPQSLILSYFSRAYLVFRTGMELFAMTKNKLSLVSHEVSVATVKAPSSLLIHSQSYPLDFYPYGTVTTDLSDTYRSVAIWASGVGRTDMGHVGAPPTCRKQWTGLWVKRRTGAWSTGFSSSLGNVTTPLSRMNDSIERSDSTVYII